MSRPRKNFKKAPELRHPQSRAVLTNRRNPVSFAVGDDEAEGAVWSGFARGWRLSAALCRYVKARLVGTRVPLYVSFYITYRCNLRCAYCSSSKYAGVEMTTSQIVGMIDELARLGTVQFGLTGGECTMRDDLGDVIKYAKSKGMIVTATTNGFNLASTLSDMRALDLLIVSIDGPTEVHDELRGRTSYERAVEGVKLAVGQDMRVDINTVLSRKSVPHLECLISLAADLGTTISFQPVFCYPLSADSKTVQGLQMSREQLDEALSTIRRAARNGAPIRNSASYLDFLDRNWPKGAQTSCWAGRLFFNITPGGNVQQCCFLSSEAKWPNGLETTFTDAINARPHLKCGGCFCNAYIEANEALSLRPAAVLNTMRNL